MRRAVWGGVLVLAWTRLANPARSARALVGAPSEVRTADVLDWAATWPRSIAHGAVILLLFRSTGLLLFRPTGLLCAGPWCSGAGPRASSVWQCKAQERAAARGPGQAEEGSEVGCRCAGVEAG